jgi:hypothetical protein
MVFAADDPIFIHIRMKWATLPRYHSCLTRRP